MSAPHTVVVSILDKDYQIACPAEQEGDLIAAARQLDARMRTVRDGGKVVGLERIAVMVALNTSYDLLMQERTTGPDIETADQLKRLSDRIDDALERFRQLEIG